MSFLSLLSHSSENNLFSCHSGFISRYSLTSVTLHPDKITFGICFHSNRESITHKTLKSQQWDLITDLSVVVNKQAYHIDTCQGIISSDVLVMASVGRGGRLFANSHFTLSRCEISQAHKAVVPLHAQWSGSLRNTKLSFP